MVTMKKMSFIVFLIFSLTYSGKSQAYHPATAMEMNDYLQQVVESSETEYKMPVIRAECGIFSMRDVVDYSTRTLYPGHQYIIKLFTDRMIPDVRLVLWQLNTANNKYVRIDSSEKNELPVRNIKSDLLGSMVEVTVTPAAAAEYSFQIVSTSDRNRTGRFGVIIQQTDVPQNSNKSSQNSGTGSGGYRPVTRNNEYRSTNRSGSDQGSNEHNGGATTSSQVYIRTGSYEWVYLKENFFTHHETPDGSWQTQSVKGLFAVNIPMKTIEQLEPANLKGTFRINNVNTQGKVITYQTTHETSGVSATIIVDLAASTLKIRSVSNNRPYMIVYYISQIN
jgi:hypothetical protein